MINMFLPLLLLMASYCVLATTQSTKCTVRENLQADSVNISCSMAQASVPQARTCSFTRSKNGGLPVYITKPVTYSRTPTANKRSVCSVSVPVEQLGEGTHRFQVSISSDATSDDSLRDVITTVTDRNLTLSFPEVKHSCSSDLVRGYILGNSVRCMCTLKSPGYPRGRAGWIQRGLIVGISGVLLVTFDKYNLPKIYSCEAKSPLGWKFGSVLVAKFAFFTPDSVEIERSPAVINSCDNTSQVLVTCRVSNQKVNPAPIFGLSIGEILMGAPQPGRESTDGSHYERQFPITPDRGLAQIKCIVTNTVTNTSQERKADLLVREPPPSPPVISVGDQTYQGTDPSNVVTLPEGYTGNVTCRVEGGYPRAHTTQLKCGFLVSTGDGNTARLRFESNPLSKIMEGVACICTSQHDSGCYSNKETKLTLKVSEDSSDSIISGIKLNGVNSLIVIVIIVVIIVAITVINICVCRKRCFKKKRRSQQNASAEQGQQNRSSNYIIPLDTLAIIRSLESSDTAPVQETQTHGTVATGPEDAEHPFNAAVTARTLESHEYATVDIGLAPAGQTPNPVSAPLYDTPTATGSRLHGTPAANGFKMYDTLPATGSRLHDTLPAKRSRMHDTPAASGSIMHDTPASAVSRLHGTPAPTVSRLHDTLPAKRSRMHDTPAASGSIMHDTPVATVSRLHGTPASAGSRMHDSSTSSWQQPRHISSLYSHLEPCTSSTSTEVYHTCPATTYRPETQEEHSSGLLTLTSSELSELTPPRLSSPYSDQDPRTSSTDAYRSFQDDLMTLEEDTSSTVPSEPPSLSASSRESDGLYAHLNDEFCDPLEVYQQVSEPLRGGPERF